jgi:hypothetical protein
MSNQCSEAATTTWQWKQQNMKTKPGPAKRRIGDVEGLIAGRRYGEGVDLTPQAPSAGALK